MGTIALYKDMKMNLNRDFLLKFCKEFEYPDEAQKALDDALTAVENSEVRAKFADQLSRYPSEMTTDEICDMLSEVKKLEPKIDCRHETVELLFFVLLAEPLKVEYQKAGLTDKMYHDAMLDLRAKTYECYENRGVWGSFVAIWFPRFFAVDRFAFTRLQFELITLEQMTSIDGQISVADGQKAVNIHIPSLGPLDMDAVKVSLKQAAEFFAPHFPDGKILFFCHSWLLYPPHHDMLPANSRILQFADMFHIFESWESREDLWRIFGPHNVSDIAGLPRDTGLRRAYAERLEQGLPVGQAKGAFYY